LFHHFCKLSENFLDKYAAKFTDDCWYHISYYQMISEQFIEKYSDKLRWAGISLAQELSEQFMEKHSDKLTWDYISMSQKLSEDFIERHMDKLYWQEGDGGVSHLDVNIHLSSALKKKIKNRINEYWEPMSRDEDYKEFKIKVKDRLL